MRCKVFVLDRRGRPLMPCTAKRSRKLLEARRARIHLYVPFTIRLTDRLAEDSVLQPVTVKIDPGSRTTGFAVIRERNLQEQGHLSVLYLLELQHRGLEIRARLHQRAMYRRNRRVRKTRYRPARFSNRTKPRGWLAPSLLHRVNSTVQQIRRFQRLVPATALAQELVRFDTQQLQNPQISGIEYQQGTLVGYEIREYLLEKFKRRCAYCNVDAADREMQIDHVRARARGGSNRVSNLVLACWKCNRDKGARSVEEFLASKPDALARIQRQLRTPLRDAAAVNATRWRLYDELKGLGLPVSVGTGGRTKWNRRRFGIEKTHAHDALCVGIVKTIDTTWRQYPSIKKCRSRGCYRRVTTNKFGFARSHRARRKFAFGFKTGDLAIAIHRQTRHGRMLNRRCIGTVSIRQRGYFLFTRLIDGCTLEITHRSLKKIY